MHKRMHSSGWPFRLCQGLLVSALVCFAITLSHPRLKFTEQQEKLDTRAFWVCLDRSGSMNTQVPGNGLATVVQKQINDWHARRKAIRMTLPPELRTRLDEPEKVDPTGPTRFQLARYFSGELMNTRPKGDRFGVSIFNDMSDTKIIPSLDLRFVQQLLYDQQIDFGGGTNFDGPTGPNQPKGAIQECIDGFNLEDNDGNQLCPETTRIIMLISDGDAGISEKRFAELLEQMQQDPKRPIRIYGFVIGAPDQMQNDNVKSLRRFTSQVNGPDWPDSVFLATDADQLDRCFKFFQTTEKTSTIAVTKVRYEDISRPWLVAGCLLLTLFGLVTWPLRINN